MSWAFRKPLLHATKIVQCKSALRLTAHMNQHMNQQQNQAPATKRKGGGGGWGFYSSRSEMCRTSGVFTKFLVRRDRLRIEFLRHL